MMDASDKSKSSFPARCIFATDLHGHIDRYERLFEVIEREHPTLVFLGGDLLPSYLMHLSSPMATYDSFIRNFLRPRFQGLRNQLGRDYPTVCLILGNDDLRAEEEEMITSGADGLWHYLHNRRMHFNDFTIFGYACVPPTPFRLKDWERYDVSRYVDPGCTHPMEGSHSVAVNETELKHTTIKGDLEMLADAEDMTKAVFLFHTPPHDTDLDCAALDGVMVDHVPLDVHVGSIAVRRFIETRQPYLTLHGHVHESARITGSWRQRIGRTHAFSAAHDGTELCVLRFLLEDLDGATRELL